MSLPEKVWWCEQHGEANSEQWCPGGPVAAALDTEPCRFITLPVAGPDDLVIRRDTADLIVRTLDAATCESRDPSLRRTWGRNRRTIRDALAAAGRRRSPSDRTGDV